MGLLPKKVGFAISKALKRDGKKWPIHVRKYVLRGDDFRIEDDRARTLKKENGELELEMLREPDKTVSVGYEYFTNRNDGKEEVELLKPARGSFLPIKNSLKGEEKTVYHCSGCSKKYVGSKPDECERCNVKSFDSGTEYSGLDVDKIHDVKNWKLWAEKEFREDAKIVEIDEKKWWESPKIQAAILFFGAGLFFTLVGFGYGQVWTEKAVKAFEEIQRQQAAQNLLPLIGFKVKLWKKQLIKN